MLSFGIKKCRLLAKLQFYPLIITCAILKVCLMKKECEWCLNPTWNSPSKKKEKKYTEEEGEQSSEQWISGQQGFGAVCETEIKSISLSTDPVSRGAPHRQSLATALTETSRPWGPSGSPMDTEVNKVVPSCQTKALKQQQNNRPCCNASLLSDSTGDMEDVAQTAERVCCA